MTFSGCKRLFRKIGVLSSSNGDIRNEESALEKLIKASEKNPHLHPGTVEIMGYRIDYHDLPSLVPQWRDIFVRNVLRFHIDRESPTIIDCGANVGLATLFFKRLYPNARIKAFEADTKLFNVLTRNVQVNKLKGVETIHAAVWVNDKGVRFRSHGGDSGAVEQYSVVERAEAVDVPSMRLKDLLATLEVDFIKMDIEGSEYEVLLDCADELRRVPGLIVELHETTPNRRITSSILQLLESIGFSYTMEELTTMWWHPSKTKPDHFFPSLNLRWVVLVRAWQEKLIQRQPN